MSVAVENVNICNQLVQGVPTFLFECTTPQKQNILAHDDNYNIHSNMT